MSVTTCTVQSIEKIARESENGALLVFSQRGCPYCPPYLKLAKQAVGDRIKVLEAPIEKGDCSNLADKYKVSRTPTVFYYDNKGRQAKKLKIDEKSYKELKDDLLKLIPAQKSSLSAPTQPSVPKKPPSYAYPGHQTRSPQKVRRRPRLRTPIVYRYTEESAHGHPV